MYDILVCHFRITGSRQRVISRYKSLSGKRFDYKVMWDFPRLADGPRRGIDDRRHIAEEFYATVMDTAPNYVHSGTLRGRYSTKSLSRCRPNATGGCSRVRKSTVCLHVDSITFTISLGVQYR